MNETEARELLRAAAGTIDVPPGREIEVDQPRRPRWVVPVAAAVAVVVAIGGAALLAGRDGARETTPAPPPATPTPTLDDGMPSVFAYDADSAEKMLERLGLVVTRRTEEASCGRAAGRAVRTVPGRGVSVAPGDRVELVVTVEFEGLCAGPTSDRLAWRFLDFANARGPAPEFSDEVDVTVNGNTYRLTAPEDRSTWPQGSLDLLAGVSRVVGSSTTATLKVSSLIPDDEGCGGYAVPEPLRGRTSLTFWMSAPPLSNLIGVVEPCTYTDLYLDPTGRHVDAVVIRTSIYDLIPPDMHPTPTVDPGPNARARELARSFEAFADGDGFDLATGDSVPLFLGNDSVMTLDSDQLRDRDTYSLCPPMMSRDCGWSPTTVIDAFEHQAAITDFVPKGCLEPGFKTLEASDVGADDFVVLSLPEPRTCADDWAVQLFYDEGHRLMAINLLLGSEH